MTHIIRTTAATALIALTTAGIAGADVVSLDSCRSLALRNNKTIAIADETVT